MFKNVLLAYLLLHDGITPFCVLFIGNYATRHAPFPKRKLALYLSFDCLVWSRRPKLYFNGWVIIKCWRRHLSFVQALCPGAVSSTRRKVFIITWYGADWAHWPNWWCSCPRWWRRHSRRTITDLSFTIEIKLYRFTSRFPFPSINLGWIDLIKWRRETVCLICSCFLRCCWEWWCDCQRTLRYALVVPRKQSAY